MKDRCDAWYSCISKADQIRLHNEVLIMPWHRAVKLIAERLHINEPSRASFYRWISKIEKQTQSREPGGSLEARVQDLEKKYDAISESVFRMFNLFEKQNDALIARHRDHRG